MEESVVDLSPYLSPARLRELRWNSFGGPARMLSSHEVNSPLIVLLTSTGCYSSISSLSVQFLQVHSLYRKFVVFGVQLAYRLPKIDKVNTSDGERLSGPQRKVRRTKKCLPLWTKNQDFFVYLPL